MHMYKLVKYEQNIVFPFDSYDKDSSKYYGMFNTGWHLSYDSYLKILFKKTSTSGFLSYKIVGDDSWKETHIYGCYEEEKDTNITISTLYSKDKKYRIVFLFDNKYYRGPLLKFDMVIYEKM